MVSLTLKPTALLYGVCDSGLDVQWFGVFCVALLVSRYKILLYSVLMPGTLQDTFDIHFVLSLMVSYVLAFNFFDGVS